MKKLILVLPILLFILFMPFIVKAETCDIDKIAISSITIEDKSENVVEIDEATASGKSINLNLSMSEIGDNIKYKIVIKNDSNEDYELDKNSINIQSDYIDYTYESEGDSNIIKANTSKTIYLKIQYKNEVPDEVFENNTFNDNKNISLQLTAGDSISVPNTLKNPNTGNSYICLIIIVLIISGISFILLRKKKYAKYICLIIGVAIIIPVSVYALCKCDIIVESKIRIDKNSESAPIYLYGRIYGVDIGDSVNITKIEDPTLVEQYGDTLYLIGDSGFSTNADIMFNIYSNDPIFFKLKIEDNVITGIGIEYMLNNKRYSLTYDPSYFEDNKQVLDNSFIDVYGDNRCHSVNENHYYCQDSIGANMTGAALSDGSINFEINHFGCSMNQYKTNCALD